MDKLQISGSRKTLTMLRDALSHTLAEGLTSEILFVGSTPLSVTTILATDVADSYVSFLSYSVDTTFGQVADVAAVLAGVPTDLAGN